MRSTCRIALASFTLLALAGAACLRSDEQVCQSASDCPAGEFCVSGSCLRGSSDGGEILAACTEDRQCQAINAQMVCSTTGLCDLPAGGDSCNAIAECPIDQFCNFQSRVCVALQPGFCRQASQCAGQKCAASEGGMARCVDCLRDADCGDAQCLSNGSCAQGATCSPACEPGTQCSLGQCVPVAADCNPPCLTGEQCSQGVCYGGNGCPRHAHPVGGQCACDDGYEPSPSGNACVPPGTCDADAQLACQQQGGTWDAVACACLSGGACDPPCPAASTCQGSSCVPVSGACSSDADCQAGGAGFFNCDPTTSTCTCDALQAMVMCLIFGAEFNPDSCDCDMPSPVPGADASVDTGWPPSDAGARDAWAPVDAGRNSDAAAPLDAGSRDSAVASDASSINDASSSSPDALVVDAAGSLGDAAGARPGAPGAACALDSDCGGYSAAWCVESWPGGYCGGRCDADLYAGECGDQGVCLCVDRGMFGCREAYCYQPCETGASCRVGYRCDTSPGGDGKACIPQ